MSVTNPPPTLAAPTVTPLVGGFRFEFTRPSDLDFAGVRLYASETSGFTPDSTNLVGDSKGTILVTELKEETTYYYQYIPYDDFGDGAVSSELSVTTYPRVIQNVSQDTSDIRLVDRDGHIVYGAYEALRASGKYSINGSVSSEMHRLQNVGSTDTTKLYVEVFACTVQTPAYTMDMSSGVTWTEHGLSYTADADGTDITGDLSVGDYLVFPVDTPSGTAGNGGLLYIVQGFIEGYNDRCYAYPVGDTVNDLVSHTHQSHNNETVQFLKSPTSLGSSDLLSDQLGYRFNPSTPSPSGWTVNGSHSAGDVSIALNAGTGGLEDTNAVSISGSTTHVIKRGFNDTTANIILYEGLTGAVSDGASVMPIDTAKPVDFSGDFAIELGDIDIANTQHVWVGVFGPSYNQPLNVVGFAYKPVTITYSIHYEGQ